jgi:hypothetical protein
MRLHPRERTASGVVSLLLLSAALTACGKSAESDWYYHWSCNGDPDCLALNPTGAPSGTLNEGPVEVNCTQLMEFASRFWGSAAFNSCDHSASFDGGGGVGTYAPRISGFAPTTVSQGSTLTIDGTNFIVGGTTVAINGVGCPITSSTTTQLVCVIPAMNDFVGPIAVATSQGSSTSSTDLTVAHAGSVYWSAYNDGSLLPSFTGGIDQVSKGGGAVSAVEASLSYPSRLAVDSRYIYYTQTAPTGFVAKVEIRTGYTYPVASGVSYPDAVAVDATAVYWTEFNGNTGTTVKKVPLATGGTVTVASQPAGMLTCAGYCVKRSNLVVDATDVYWGQQDGIYRAPIAGGAVTRLAPRSGMTTTEIAVDAGNVYWLEPTSIEMVPKSGGVATSFATGLAGPTAIAADAASVYWIDGTSVRKASSGGGAATTIATAYGPSTGMAVDSTSVYWIDGMWIRKVGLGGGTPTNLANPVYGPPRSIVVDLP